MKVSIFTFSLILIITLNSCKEKNDKNSLVAGKELDLKRGDLISCGPPSLEFGTVDFDFSCSAGTKEDFNMGVKLLHSFEYDEAEKVFARVIDKQPDCAMAYWGVAMANFHALWTPPTEAELKKGAKAVDLAKAQKGFSEKEGMYIESVAAFFKDWEKLAHPVRTLAFEKAMENLYNKYPGDKEAAIFYALSLVAAADPSDKTYGKQKKAGSILGELYTKYPNHPGVVHYTIHTYDSPELANLGLDAAKKYAAVAPSSAHALHMPSHIFTRMGLWDESIQSNQASIASAICYAESAGIKGHWDEEVHSLDYLVYAYLQNGQEDSARKQWDYLKTIKQVWPDNFKVAYSFAAIPSRYLLENKMWKEAAELKPHVNDFAWSNYPWQKSIIHFTNLLGSVNTGNLSAANIALDSLNKMYQQLVVLKDDYKANQVDIQRKAGMAWIRFKEGKSDEALTLMIQAKDMEDNTGKHPVTPGEVLPARQLLADMLLAMNQPEKALQAYEADLEKHPNRFNALYGAAISAEKSGNMPKARIYYQQLIDNTSARANRIEVQKATKFLKG